DGIRDATVTGVQTCALPISNVVVGDIEGWGYGVSVEAYESWMAAFESVTGSPFPFFHLDVDWVGRPDWPQAALQLEALAHDHGEIGRASCREGGEIWVRAVG